MKRQSVSEVPHILLIIWIYWIIRLTYEWRPHTYLSSIKTMEAKIPGAWVKSSVLAVKPYTKVNVNVNKYFQEIKPLFILQRAFGYLPYSFNKKGFAPFKLLSFSLLYTLIYFLVQSTWTIYSMYTLAKIKIFNAPSYDLALFWVSICLILVLNLITPIAKWIEAPKVVRLVSCWQDFQDNHMDAEMEMPLSLPIKIIAILIVPTAFIFVCIELYILTDISFLVMIPFIPAVSVAVASLADWCATLYELRFISRVLLNKIIMNECRQMATHRRTWLELSKLVSEFGKSHAFTGMVICTTLFTSLILSTYTLLSSVFDWTIFSNHFWGLLVGAIVGFICNFTLCDAAYRTTREVGSRFSSKILALDLTHLNQYEINEICLLLQTMSAHPPVVTYIDFVTIDRSLFVSIISNLVTYLVVLVQFKSSPPLTISNEDSVQ